MIFFEGPISLSLAKAEAFLASSHFQGMFAGMRRQSWGGGSGGNEEIIKGRGGGGA